MPINNFVLATAPLGAERARRINRDDLAVVDSRFVVNYFHNSPDHRLLFGGGENYSPRFPRDLKRSCAASCWRSIRGSTMWPSTTPGAARWPSP
jgi:glycine/D-amino acid oxidase-like deaminating enzyme